MKRITAIAAAGFGVLTWSAGVQAAVVIDTVTVGNPGNPGELSGEGAGGAGPDRICGAVGSIYNIGKYEVTAGQYTEFLNAVAAEDTYGLYTPDMWSSSSGCKIERSGGSGSYTYSVASDWAQRPVNCVSFWDAARFANWMHNRQPTGAQDPTTTEDGAYALDGYTGYDGSWISRNPGATWFIPTEDEWYKAAYYDGDAALYYDYPTGTDAVPNNGNPEGDTGNSANFWDGDYTIGSPYWRTEAGFFQLSDSPYGTFDQGGNAWEWNEALVLGSYRGVRGGSFEGHDSGLHAAFRADYCYPPTDSDYLGFRVAEVPEPAAITWLAFASLGVVRRRRLSS